jgi:hypothetical protein
VQKFKKSSGAKGLNTQVFVLGASVQEVEKLV